MPVETCRVDFVIPPTGKLPKLITAGGKSQTASNATNRTFGDLDAKKQQELPNCEVPFPAIARHRSRKQSEVVPLKARFVILERIQQENGHEFDRILETVDPFFLTRVQKREPNSLMRLLLNSGSKQSFEQDPDSTDKNADKNEEPMWIPYLKFGRAPIRIRFVAEDRQYSMLQRADGVGLRALNASFYGPMIYVDELSLQESAQIELAPFEDNRPPVKIQIRFGSISPMIDALYRQIKDAFQMIEGSVFQGPELDELRYFLQDENLYRFALTNVISTVHMWLDYLAFRDEVRFYRGRQSLSGVSPSSVITKMICSLIILLYLIDGGGTSWIVLFSLFSSFAVEVWKVFKLLRPTLTSEFPFVKIREFSSKQEQETAEYDSIACRKLSMVLYPIVFCWSVYALKHYEYKSVYSWFISNMANGVYTFGFISMCPQLYVNYRLKSVAHLPWKVFMYKIFNTFVDDAFAWLVEMPLKHRLMTLRDDVVFLCFLVQVYLYRVDKTRSNEFGYSYEDDETNDKIEDDDNRNTTNSLDQGKKEPEASATEKAEKLKAE